MRRSYADVGAFGVDVVAFGVDVAVPGVDVPSELPAPEVAPDVLAADAPPASAAGAVPAEPVAPKAPGELGVAELPGAPPWGWRKTTVSDPVLLFGWTCTSATNPPGSPQGSLPPGPALPATWVTLPRNR